jgi:hypothetical protein
MKDLYDIYEDGTTAATPGNTTGMGNPTPPTDGEVGSEPMCGKGKCKRKKKRIEEAILVKSSDKVKNLDTVAVVAEWFAAAHNIKDDSFLNEMTEEYAKQITYNGDGTYDIDTSLATVPKWSLDLIDIPEDGIPKWLKIRNFHCDWSKAEITSKCPDLSNLNWSFFTGKSKRGSVSIKFWCEGDIKLGAIKCDEMTLFSSASTSIKFSPKTEVVVLKMRNCSGIKWCDNIPKTIKRVELPGSLVANYIKEKGLIPMGASVEISMI